MSDYSEREICTKFITPAIMSRGWVQASVREEVRLTDGRVVVRGKVARRILDPKSLNGPRRADYVLFAYPGVALAVIEAKRDIFPLGHGMQQALVNAEMLDAPFEISSNGTGIVRQDLTSNTYTAQKSSGGCGRAEFAIANRLIAAIRVDSQARQRIEALENHTACR